MSTRRVVQRHSSIISGGTQPAFVTSLFGVQHGEAFGGVLLSCFSSSAALCQKTCCLGLRYR
jgi:hypothetical protein